jgi:hypothetical protein
MNKPLSERLGEVIAAGVEQRLWDEINAEIRFNLDLIERGRPVPAGDVVHAVKRAMSDVGHRHGLETR